MRFTWKSWKFSHVYVPDDQEQPIPVQWKKNEERYT